jgi:pentatricopeptide repeat protein
VASVEKLNVLSPKALVDKLQDMSKKLPEFRISAITMGMVLDVMIKTTDRKQAPFLAEEFLRFLESESTTYRDLKPHVYIYTQVINAWVKSGFPEAESKITSLRRRMEDAGVSPTMVTYNTLLRFYGTQANASMITQLLEEMQKAKNVTPDLVTYNEAVYGYARAEDMENAQRIFERMLGLKERDGVKKGDILGEAAQQILLAYRNMVESASSRSNRSNIITAMGKAEDFFKKYIERESRLSSSSMGKY